jgi:hypothetical protein
MVNYYGGSPSKAIMSLFPEYEWHVWRFEYTPKDFNMMDKVHHRSYFNWVFQQLKLNDFEDWYDVKLNDLTGFKYCMEILNYCYNGSLKLALKKVYSHYNWQEWKFNKVSSKFWKDSKNLNQYMEWLGQQFQIKTLDDWYGITEQHMDAFGGYGAISEYGIVYFN